MPARLACPSTGFLEQTMTARDRGSGDTTPDEARLRRAASLPLLVLHGLGLTIGAVLLAGPVLLW